MYLELKAGEYIHVMCRQASYEQSPYFTLNERKRRTLSLGRDRPNLVQQPMLTDDVHYDKAHAFRVQNFKGLTWCDLCGNFMFVIFFTILLLLFIFAFSSTNLYIFFQVGSNGPRCAVRR